METVLKQHINNIATTYQQLRGGLKKIDKIKTLAESALSHPPLGH